MTSTLLNIEIIKLCKGIGRIRKLVKEQKENESLWIPIQTLQSESSDLCKELKRLHDLIENTFNN